MLDLIQRQSYFIRENRYNIGVYLLEMQAMV